MTQFKTCVSNCQQLCFVSFFMGNNNICFNTYNVQWKINNEINVFAVEHILNKYIFQSLLAFLSSVVILKPIERQNAKKLQF